MTDIRSGVPRPDFERDVLISQLRQAYLGLMEARETLGSGAGLQRASEAVIGELEALALVLTGDGQYFRRDRSHKGAGALIGATSTRGERVTRSIDQDPR